ncbi:UNVERIFIED_CONTAM: hypothetical protein O8I53_05635 [Campylobacter lari]
MGGSAGVTGIIGEYLSVYKQKDFGTMNGYINIIIIVISVLIGTYIPASLISQDFEALSKTAGFAKLNATDKETVIHLASLA